MSALNDRVAAQIEFLADHPQHADTIAGWIHAQWGHETPDVSQESRVARIRSSAVKGQIPLTMLALVDQLPVGSACLVHSDMSIRPELTPWLASVYVSPEWQGHGIGSQLVVRMVQKARALETQSLYLFTPDRVSFYARLGWQVLEICEYRGHESTVMIHDLRSIPIG